VVIAPPPSSETVLDVLGAIPFKPNPAIAAADAQASSQAAMEYLKTIYQDVSQQAILAAMRVETSADS
jgi:uncharacterized Zn finger protein